jgi:GntR family transcriptional repressor for pyruvate dehydrogenase complex
MEKLIMSVVFKPVNNQTIRIQVVEQIVKMIREGKLKPGDQLPSERVVAEQMGISRPTVREAFAALEVVGMVETRIGQGTFIKIADLESLKYRAESLFVEERSPFETLEVRKILESHSAALAASRGSDEDIFEIEKALRILAEEAGKFQTWSDTADISFHKAIANSSGNSVLSDLFNILLDMSHYKVWQKLKEIGRLVPGSLEKDLQEHRSIYEAIKERNPEKAQDAVWKHFMDVERDIFGAESKEVI